LSKINKPVVNCGVRHELRIKKQLNNNKNKKMERFGETPDEQ